ncbi:MAG: RRXRR domain-containing protein [Scytonema sp. PMC 1069.18]|nr:RRXRR domain-containing protein [Scytonema sp. PMC 1069.18]MEC4881766.1 RRXRR domain-containing protein [Scytonema sp. PMC 1070.18]
MKITNRQSTRIPVVSPDNQPLMPTTPARARKWIESGKAIPKRSPIGIFYVQLTQEPSGYKLQDIAASTDRGKCFTGIAFQSKLATIAVIHTVLSGFYKSNKKTRDRQSVTGKMAKRQELRRSRRGRRIDRRKPFKLRNHRQKRFNNRRGNKLPPSVKANRLMELRILQEAIKIIPYCTLRDEDCGGNTKKNGRGISPVTVGQEWFRNEASKLVPVVPVDSHDTEGLRRQFGLTKDKSDKSKQTIETHGNDAIALAANHFVEYVPFHTANTHGHHWVGECKVTPAPFIVITRPKLFRRKLHQEEYQKGGVLKRQGGTVTPFKVRSGDYIEFRKKGGVVRGWVGGFTDTPKTKNIAIYDHNWSRIEQVNPKNIKLLNRSTKLCVVY